VIASALFSWIEGADFYREVHAAAVALLPAGEGARWLDVGCGPGLVSRLAAERGYRVRGVDADGGMIRAARRLAARSGSNAAFATGSVFDLPPASAEVVSAASLLAVLDGRQAALAALWSALVPGGTLLIIEPSARMNLANARRYLRRAPRGRRSYALLLWAWARRGRAVAAGLFDTLPAAGCERVALLDGMLDARLLRKLAA